MPRRIEPAELASVLPPGGLTLVSGCSAESGLLADAVELAGAALGDMTFCGIVVGGLNKRTWRAGPDSRVLTFFQTPELRAEGDRVTFLPLCYEDALAELRRRRPAAALFMCAPPNEEGNCSFGTEVSFVAELWREIPVRIAHLNPMMPRTAGDPGIPFEEIIAVVDDPQPLLALPQGGSDGLADAIATYVAPLIRDGDTLQVGLGKVPDAVARALTGRKHLKVHTGLLGDGLMDLIESGAIDHAIVGTAIGTPALYDRLRHAALEFRPVSKTHGSRVLAAIERLVTLNSALEVDLYGQAYAELTPKGLMSGPGGASDYARGARPGSGLRIVALPSVARDTSRIVPPGRGRGPVSLGRFDIDVIVTEHGAADLRGLDHTGRARALIAVAAPDHRPSLETAWAEHARGF